MLDLIAFQATLQFDRTHNPNLYDVHLQQSCCVILYILESQWLERPDSITCQADGLWQTFLVECQKHVPHHFSHFLVLVKFFSLFVC
ncbi:hypothetical protein LguiB_018898 [Lonicera macranthoides]